MHTVTALNGGMCYLVVFALPLEDNAISFTRLRQTTMYIVDFAFY